MHIEMIAIGDELLDGRTQDANFHYLGGRLRAHGIHLDRVTVVPDEPDTLVALFQDVAKRADLIVTSGGLGPTRDDRTRYAIATAAGQELQFHQEIYDKIRAYFASIHLNMPELNRRQAMIPHGATIHSNPNGTADGFEVDIDGTPLLALPGVPAEFRYLIETVLMPRYTTDKPRISHTFHVFGRGESEIAKEVEALQLPDTIKVTWRPSFPILTIELSADPHNEDHLTHGYNDVVDRIFPWIFEAPTQSVSEALAAAVIEQEITLSTAESCTGGLLASKLTDIPGASAWFKRGYVTYSNEAKRSDLGVPADLLESVGAVSYQVAGKMAYGARAIAGTPLSIAVTGIAGPGGGTAEKPVGRVFICASLNDRSVTLEVQAPKTSRHGFKKYVSEFAMFLALRMIQGRESELEHFRGVRAMHTHKEK